MPLKRLGILTGGGDAPGLNAVIRAVVKASHSVGCEVIGLEDSFDGLVFRKKSRSLNLHDVTGILRRGGTILGTVNTGNPFDTQITTPEGTFAYADRVIQLFSDMALDALVCIGGDGTLAIAYEFHKRGIPLVGVPKTIDNDIVGTTSCFGFDTAVSFATDAIDRLHTTAEAHRRVMVVEVMGRHTGWIALHAGVAGGADVILIPEIHYEPERVVETIRRRDEWGAAFSIVVVAEGARPVGGEVSLVASAHDGKVARLGGIGQRCARRLGPSDGQGNSVRGAGAPAAGWHAHGIRSDTGHEIGRQSGRSLDSWAVRKMVANNPPNIVAIQLEDVVGRTKTVPLDYDLLATARSLGIGFGD